MSAMFGRPLFNAADGLLGVAGNHILFGKTPSVLDQNNFLQQLNTHFLDGHVVELGGLKIAGLSGIVVNPRKPFHCREQDFLDAVSALCVTGPGILIMHEGQDFPPHHLRGSPTREVLEKARPKLVIRGHAYWELPLVVLTNRAQILNVDARVVQIVRAG